MAKLCTRTGLRTFALTMTMSGLGCGGDDGGSPFGASGGSSSGSYTFYLACDATLGGIEHTCSEYYGKFPKGYPAQSSFKQQCDAMQGTALSGKCPTSGSVGGCNIVSESGGYGEQLTQYYYAADGNTAADIMNICAGSGTYVVPGGATTTTPSTTTPSTGTSASSGSGFSFSVLTSLNGASLECTNYFGVPTDELTTEIANMQGMTTPCPTANASSVCDIKSGGPFNNDRYQLVSYDFMGLGDDSTPDDCKSSGGAYSTTYKTP